MSWVFVAMGVTAVAGGMKAYGQYQQGVQQKRYYDYLADSSRTQGEYAYRTGMKQSELSQDAAKYRGKIDKTQVLQFASSQRAALAANGIDLSSVSSADIMSDTMSKSRLDELAFRFNADSKSWSMETDAKYKRWSGQVEGQNYNYAGSQAKYAGKQQAFSTLLSTAASVASIGFGGVGGGGSTTTSGIAGRLKGYRSGTPPGSLDMKTHTLLPKG